MKYASLLKGGEVLPGMKQLTNFVQLYFDSNGNVALAFYGQDQYGIDGTNVLRTCLGTDGAMC